jgi:ABC-type lipoprotein export system ATPase subunit
MATRSSNASAPIVEVRRLKKQYPSGDELVTIFDNVNFSIKTGEFFAILGFSGSGKTTLLNVIGGLDVPTSGEVRVFGKSVTSMSPDARTKFRRDHLGFVFQFYNLLPALTAIENVKVGMELQDLPRSEIADRAEHYLRAVGLKGKEHRRPAQLSGGEQQRVAIARALAKKPALILADEPTGNLDRGTGRSIMALMRELNSELGTTFVVVTHDTDVSALADNTYNVEAPMMPMDARMPVEARLMEVS